MTMNLSKLIFKYSYNKLLNLNKMNLTDFSSNKRKGIVLVSALVVVLVAIGLLFYVLNGKSAKGFVVQGKIENLEGKTVFLSEYKESGIVNIDSIVMPKSGNFKLVGETTFPKFFLLRISPTDHITLLIDSTDIINISANSNNFISSYKVDGPENMMLVKQLEDRIQLTLSKKDSLAKVYEASIDSKSVDSLAKEIDKKFNKIVEEQIAFSKKFIEAHPGSMANLLALSQQIIPGSVNVFTMPDDMVYYEKVYSSLSIKYPISPDVIQLHNFITRAKSQNQRKPVAKSYGIGDIVPDISLNNQDGKIISLYSLRGKYVLLQFWAGWSRESRRDNAKLVRNYQKYKSKGFEIFQVSLDKEKSRWIEAIKEDQLGEWLHGSDLLFWGSTPAKAYNISTIPTNFLLNKNGEVIAINLYGEALGAKLQEIFNF
jgi:hypothetical protein